MLLACKAVGVAVGGASVFSTKDLLDLLFSSFPSLLSLGRIAAGLGWDCVLFTTSVSLGGSSLGASSLGGVSLGSWMSAKTELCSKFDDRVEECISLVCIGESMKPWSLPGTSAVLVGAAAADLGPVGVALSDEDDPAVEEKLSKSSLY